MAKDDRELLEGIASDMGADRPEGMTDTELIDYITGGKRNDRQAV